MKRIILRANIDDGPFPSRKLVILSINGANALRLITSGTAALRLVGSRAAARCLATSRAAALCLAARGVTARFGGAAALRRTASRAAALCLTASRTAALFGGTAARQNIIIHYRNNLPIKKPKIDDRATKTNTLKNENWYPSKAIGALSTVHELDITRPIRSITISPS